MLSKLSTMIGSIFGVSAMVAAILGEGPMWIQVTGAIAIAVLLVSGSLINGTARDSISRIDTFISEIEKESSSVTETVMMFRDDEDDTGTNGPGYH